MIIHKMEERGDTRRRVPSSFSHKEGTRPFCGAKAGPAKIFVEKKGPAKAELKQQLSTN
ncbi:hypothetical protein P4S95_04555 [Aneurinibacillus aneurinilyticus]|nr:hypothetical protein [Aneurinibacillus aneurinilyticus]